MTPVRRPLRVGLLVVVLVTLATAVSAQFGRLGKGIPQTSAAPPPPPPGDIINQSRVSFVGYMRQPSTVVDTQFTGGAISGRMVNGHFHLFVYGNSADKASGQQTQSAWIATGSSSTEFALNSGQVSGLALFVGERLNVYRSATNNALPESTLITNLAGDTITVSPALGAAPRAFRFDQVSSGASATVFTLGVGSGAHFSVGDTIGRYIGGGTLDKNATITTIATDTITVSPAFAGTPTSADFMLRSDWIYTEGAHVYEMTDPESYGADPLTAPRATSPVDWGDLYRGRRVSWNADGTLDAPLGGHGDGSAPGPLSTGMYWNETTQLLYLGYKDNYAVGGEPRHTLLASGLDNGPACGPWRIKSVDNDGRVWYGTRANYILNNPANGKMQTFGAQGSGAANISWGPGLYGDTNWPTCSTPGGADAANYLIQPLSHYLDFYIMNGSYAFGTGNYFDYDGTLHGNARSFRYPSGYKYVWEWEDLSTAERSNPAKNPGLYTWDSGIGAVNGAISLALTHTKGILYAATLPAGSGTDLTDCNGVTTAHTVYTNEGKVNVEYTAASGTFAFNDVVTGSTSHAAGFATYVSPIHNNMTLEQADGSLYDFSVGETITGAPSGATGTVTKNARHGIADGSGHGAAGPGICYHGCVMPIKTTGNVTSKSLPVFIIYNPDTLATVKAGAAADYSPDPDNIINLEAVYNLHTAPRTVSGNAKKVAGFAWDPTRNYLFVAMAGADTSTPPGCTTNCLEQTLFGVFHIDDN